MRAGPIVREAERQKSRAGRRVSLITSEQEMAGLAAGWLNLEKSARNANPFFSYSWSTLWWKTFGVPTEHPRSRLKTLARNALYGLLGRARDLYVIAGQSGNGVEFVAPFVRVRYRLAGINLRCLEFLTEAGAGSCDLLVGADPASDVSELMRFLVEHNAEWDCLDLRNIDEASVVPDLLGRAAAEQGLEAEILADTAHLIIPIESDWKSELGRRSKNSREIFRKKQSRLERAGAVIRVLDDPSVEPGLAARMAEVEAHKTAKDAPALRLMPFFVDFYDRLFKALGPQQRMYAALLEIDNELVAYEWGFRTDEAILAYNKAYLHKSSYFSPGMMLIPAVLDFGYARGCRYYDFLRNDQAYKRRWYPQARRASRVRIWQRTPRSRSAAAMFFQVRPMAYRGLSKLRLRYTPEWDL